MHVVAPGTAAWMMPVASQVEHGRAYANAADKGYYRTVYSASEMAAIIAGGGDALTRAGADRPAGRPVGADAGGEGTVGGVSGPCAGGEGGPERDGAGDALWARWRGREDDCDGRRSRRG